MNGFKYELTETISSEKGLYRGATKGTREERANIFATLLKDRYLGINFFLKSDPNHIRFVLAMRNSTWIAYDPEEINRQEKRAASIRAGGKVASVRKAPDLSSGIIPVYDMMKSNWISFDVDNVEAVRGVISTEIDMIWIARQEYQKQGLKPKDTRLINDLLPIIPIQPQNGPTIFTAPAKPTTGAAGDAKLTEEMQKVGTY
jgi:hypothetical protein